MIIGDIGGYNINYDGATDTLRCKEIEVSAKDLLESYNSPVDRVNVKSNLVLRKTEGFNQLGCFSIDQKKSQLLIKRVKQARNEYSRSISTKRSS
mgnify:FL=1|tara:strand:+ start:2186 stop:2470 length:285 start_codon:yes stop_codon:yes gene_type:complete